MELNQNSNKLIVISGPTAVGKSDTAVELAKLIGGAVISADSMQVYRGMDIGTAKITHDEMGGIKHYGIDILEPKDNFDVSAFKTMALEAIDDIRNNGMIPILVGGTGFYTEAVIYDTNFDSVASSDSDFRRRMNEIAQDEGNMAVWNKLNEVDPESAACIHFNNLKRVIRALEYYKMTGEKISVHNKEQKEKKSPFDFNYFAITDNRDKIYERIDKRVDIMIESGLINEVKTLLDMNVSKNNTSMQAIGYKEIIKYIENEISLSDAIDLIKKESRHYAKRQLTWLRRDENVVWFNRSDYSCTKEMALAMGKRAGMIE